MIANYVRFDPNKDKRLCSLGTPKGQVFTSCGPASYPPLHNVVYRNIGKRFVDVTKEWNFAHSGSGLGVAFADWENNGKIAVACANDEQPADLFVRQKNGRFQNVAAMAGMDRLNGHAFAGMGLGWGDYDNDGRFDLFVTAFAKEVKPLFHNNGNGTFTDVAYRVGLSAPTIQYLPYGCKFADFDNDGWLDLILANGHVQSNQEEFTVADPGTYRQKAQILRNIGGRFYDVGAACGMADLPPIVGRGLAIGDYDNDGKIDVLIVDAEDKPLLLHNIGQNNNHFVGLRLLEQGRDAYNATVTLKMSIPIDRYTTVSQ